MISSSTMVPRGVGRTAMALAMGAVLGVGSPVAAGCGPGDIACQVVAGLKGALDDISDGLKSVSAKVTDNARRTAEIGNQVAAVKRFQEVLLSGTEQVLGLGRQAMQTVKHFVAGEVAEYQKFAGGGDCEGTCKAFREQLLRLVTSIERAQAGMLRLEQQLSAIQGGGSPVPGLPPLDLTLITNALRTVPGFALYPVFRGLVVLGGQGLEALNRLITLLEAIWKATNSVPNLLDIWPDCPSVMEPPVRATLIAIAGPLSQVGAPLRFVGAIFQACGKTSANGIAGGVAAGGNVTLRIKQNWVGLFGKFLDAVGTVALALASPIERRLDHCEIVVNQLTLMGMLEKPGTPREQCRPTPKFKMFPK